MCGNTKAGLRAQLKRQYMRHSDECFKNGKIDIYDIMDKAALAQQEASSNPNGNYQWFSKTMTQKNKAKRDLPGVLFVETRPCQQTG